MRVEALQDIVDQLRFAPTATARRQIDSAESLAAEIDLEQQYPLEWVVFRITGYRSDDITGLVSGAALLGDLSSMVERMCAHAKIRHNEHPDAVSTEQLAQRWSVSTKTIERWRRRGLIARRVLDDGRARARLVFMPSVVQSFEQRNTELVSHATGFTRMGAQSELQVARRAERYQRCLGWSRAQTIERLAERTGRSKEALRLLLARHEQKNPTTTTTTPNAGTWNRVHLSPDETIAALVNEWRHGQTTGALAARFEMEPSAVLRALRHWRAEQLAALKIVLPDGSRSQSEPIDHLLASPTVRTGLELGGPTELLELLALMRARVVPIGAQERLLGRAMVALRARAAEGTLELHPSNSRDPTTAALDRIETDLRWATRLKATLARPMIGVMGAQVFEALGPAADHLRLDDWRSLLHEGFHAISVGLDRWDPWSQGRPAGAVTLATGRAAARWLVKHPQANRSGQATRRTEPGAHLPEWTLGLDPWQGWLELPQSVLDCMRTPRGPHDAHIQKPLNDELCALIQARFGTAGNAPLTIAQLCALHATTPTGMERRVRTALRAACDALVKAAPAPNSVESTHTPTGPSGPAARE
jgi:RNA polymerase primary sigma factor